MALDYTALKEEVLSYFSPDERAGLQRLEKRIVRQYVNFEKPATPANRRELNFNPSKDIVAKSLKGRNLLVMCGGGKDSEMVLAGARALQLMMLEDFGETVKLRVGIGRQPGMIDVYDNLEHAFGALKLKDDPYVDLFYIDGKRTSPYVRPDDKTPPIPEDVTKLHRDNVLLNGHLFGGVGRRTFCDHCNIGLAGWIATGLAYKDGADLFMTGDSRAELNAQIGSGVPEIAEKLGVAPEENKGKVKSTKGAITIINRVAKKYLDVVHRDGAEVEKRTIDTESIPTKTRFVSFFSPTLKYESRDRMKMLTEFLGFSFDSLMFSFTESDCGNPALMCHLYGLIAEHTTGGKSSYKDGIEGYVEFATEIMEKKGFPTSLIDKMKARYKDDACVEEMRGKVEEYARRAYGLKPEHLVAMVYSPFTEAGKNLGRYLNYLKQSGVEGGHQLSVSKGEILEMLMSKGDVTTQQQPLLAQLEDLTGLNLSQMRTLYGHGLARDHFNPKTRDSAAKHVGNTTRDGDTLYTHLGGRKSGNKVEPVLYEGR